MIDWHLSKQLPPPSAPLPGGTGAGGGGLSCARNCPEGVGASLSPLPPSITPALCAYGQKHFIDEKSKGTIEKALRPYLFFVSFDLFP